MWAWKEMNAGHIKKQLQRIASSVDWTRERQLWGFRFFGLRALGRRASDVGLLFKIL